MRVSVRAALAEQPSQPAVSWVRIPITSEAAEVSTPMFFSSRSARILAAHSEAGSITGSLRYRRRVVNAAFLRTYVLVMFPVSRRSTSPESVSENSLPPTLQIAASARQIASSCFEMRSERMELMISRSSSSPSRSISAHHA